MVLYEDIFIYISQDSGKILQILVLSHKFFINTKIVVLYLNQMKIHLINYFLGFFLDNLETVNYNDTFFGKKAL